MNVVYTFAISSNYTSLTMQQSAEEEKINTGGDKEYGDPDVDGEPRSPGDDGNRPMSAPPDYDTVFTMPDFDNVPPPAVYREPVLEGQRDTGEHK